MSGLVPVLIIATVVAVWWWVAKPPAVFVVRIRDGQPQAARGTVIDAFLAAAAEVCREFGLHSCEIRGVARGRRIALWFSSGTPPAARQRFRNWWALSGWSARPGRG